MDLHHEKIVYLPPFLTPPQWAVAAYPERDALHQLQRDATTTRALLTDVRDQLATYTYLGAPDSYLSEFNSSLPHAILVQLRKMNYPAELTDAIHRMRSLARALETEAYKCEIAITELILESNDHIQLNKLRIIALQATQKALAIAEDLEILIQRVVWEAALLQNASRNQHTHKESSTLATQTHKTSQLIDFRYERQRRITTGTMRGRKPMELDGKQYETLSKALVSAFPTHEDLSQMVLFKLSIDLNQVAGGSNLLTIVFRLLIWAKAHDRLRDLIIGALDANPNNKELKAIATLLLREQSQPSAHASDEHLQRSSSSTSPPRTERVPASTSAHQRTGRGSVRPNTDGSSQQIFSPPNEPASYTTLVLQIYTDLSDEIDNLRLMQDLLNLRPGPTYRRMQQLIWVSTSREKVLQPLKILESYPPEDTDTIIAVRAALPRFVHGAEQCAAACTALQSPLPEDEFKELLTTTRSTCTRTLQVGELLLERLRNLRSVSELI